MKQLIAPLAALALLGAAPSPAPSANPGPAVSPAPRTLSVVCQRTPLWLFPPGAGVNVPIRSGAPQATLGARYGLVSGPRTTLLSFEFYETDIPVVEPGYAGLHYWLSSTCAIPT